VKLYIHLNPLFGSLVIGDTVGVMLFTAYKQLKINDDPYPTPIRYLGLLFGRRSVQRVTVLQNKDFSSPPLSPPMAIPGVSRLTISRD